MTDENNDVAKRLEELRRRRAELEKRRHEVEAAKTHNGTDGAEPPARGPRPAAGGTQPPARKKKGLLIGALVVLCLAIGAVAVYLLLMREPEAVAPVEVAERQPAMDAEAEATRVREEEQRAMLQARLDSLAALADSLSRVAGRADELEMQLGDVEDEQADLRRQLEDERRRREAEAREKERLEQEKEQLARELTETQTAVAALEEEAARGPESSPQDAEAQGTEEPVEVASLTEGEGTVAEPSGTGETRIAGLAELDDPPRAETRVEAAELARQRNLPLRSGRVLLRVLVGPTGAVEDVQVIRSLTEPLDEIAVEAMRGWTFTPPTAGGQPVRAWIRVPVVF